MTNDQLLQEIRELRNDVKDARKEFHKELGELKKEFFIFKGKAFGFITLLSVLIGYAIDLIKHK
jgi:uncharacterized membrane protein YukC